MAVAEFTLLNTRPAEQAAALEAEVRRIGGQALPCPTIRIEPLNAEEVDCDAFQGFNRVVFISVNAVEQLFRRCPLLGNAESDLPRCYAIGRATLEAGQNAGLTLSMPPGERYDSEALLARSELQSLKGERILLVKGEGGRNQLRESLVARGAQVSEWVLYRRVPEAIDPDIWWRFRQANTPVVLATSQTGLAFLLQSVADMADDAALDWLQRQPLVVFSLRIRDWAESQGWRGPIEVVPTHSDKGILQSIERRLK